MRGRLILAAFAVLLSTLALRAEPVDRDTLAEHIYAPMSLGDRISDDGVHERLDSGGAHSG